MVGIADAGLVAAPEVASAYGTSGAAALGCTRLSSSSRPGVTAATGVALGGGLLFVSSGEGFYSTPLGSSGELSSTKQDAFADSSNGALLALPAAPALLSGGSVGPELPYFGALDCSPRRARPRCARRSRAATPGDPRRRRGARSRLARR